MTNRVITLWYISVLNMFGLWAFCVAEINFHWIFIGLGANFTIVNVIRLFRYRPPEILLGARRYHTSADMYVNVLRNWYI